MKFASVRGQWICVLNYILMPPKLLARRQLGQFLFQANERWELNLHNTRRSTTAIKTRACMNVPFPSLLYRMHYEFIRRSVIRLNMATRNVIVNDRFDKIRTHLKITLHLNDKVSRTRNLFSQVKNGGRDEQRTYYFLWIKNNLVDGYISFSLVNYLEAYQSIRLFLYNSY
jgi:hypothetical protein